eukprot:Gb_18498 [translate_table: standard]
MCSAIDVESTRVRKGNSNSKEKGRKHWFLVGLSVVALVVGGSGSTLLSRFYFNQGGSSRWLRTLLPCMGWPILLLPLLLNPYKQFSIMKTPNLGKYIVICSVLGLMAAANILLYTIGLSYLPVSTFSLLSSTQLAFNAVFAFLLFRQRLSPYVVNSVVLLTFSAILLGIHSNGERAEGGGGGEYALGFVSTIGASGIVGLMFPVMQIVFRRVVGKESFGVVVQTQAYVYMVATLICMVGLLSSGELRELNGEAKRFRAGKLGYCMTLLWSAIGGQMYSLGAFGLIFLVSSLFSNVVSTVTLPIVPILGVFFFNDKLDAIKILSMMLGLWGFVSYAFGGFVDSRDAPRADSSL